MAETKLSLKERLRLYDEEKKIRDSPETLEKAKSMGYSEKNTEKMRKKANRVVASAFRSKGYNYPNNKLAYFKTLTSDGDTFKYYYRGDKIFTLIITLKDYLNDEKGYIVTALGVNPRTYDLFEKEMPPNTNENLIGFDRDVIYGRLKQEEPEPKPAPRPVLEAESEVVPSDFAPKKFEATGTKKKGFEPMSIRRQMKQRSFGSDDPYDKLLESIMRISSV